MTARVLNRKTGQVEEVPDDQVTSLVGSGSHAFEKGLQIPVVGEDGRLFNLPSENAEEAFRDGAYRWKTPEDTRAYMDRDNEQILQKNFGDTPGALGSQFLSSYTWGLSDVVAPKIADAVYGEGAGEEFKKARKIKQDLSPGLTLAGDLLGLAGGGSAIIKGAKEGHAALEGAGLVKTLLPAESAIGRIAQKTAQEVGEGAIYGLGQGISEAALGDPDEVAQNLAASTAMGGLFGGAFGAGFGALREIAPGAKAIVSKAASAVDDAFQGAVRKSVKKAGDFVLRGDENAELRAIFGDAVDSPEIRKLMENGGAEKLKNVKSQLEAGERILKEDGAKNRRALDNFIKDEPKDIRDFIRKAVLPKGGDIQTTLDDISNRITAEKAALDSSLTSMGGNSDRFRKIFSNMEKAAERLEGTPVGKEVRAFVEGEASSRNFRMAPKDYPISITHAEERDLLLNFRSKIKGAIEKADPKTKTTLDRILKGTDDFIYNSEAYGQAQKGIDKLSNAHGTVANFLLNQSGEVKNSLLKKILVGGEKAAEYDTVLSNVSNVLPEIEAFRVAGNDAVKQEQALQAIQTRIKELTKGRRAAGESLSTDEYRELLTSLKAKPDLMDRLDRLATVQKALTEQGATPATKYLAVQSALGNPIDQEALKLLTHGEWFQKLEKHFSKEYSDRGVIDKLVGLVTKRGIRTMAGAAIGGGITGDSTGAVLGASAASMVSPYMVLKNLSRIEQISQGSANRFKKATEKVVDALTSERGIRQGVGAAVKARSLKDARKDFKERAKFLSSMAHDPEALATEFENRFGDMQQTPSISAAMMQQFINTSQFLESKLPKDPLSGQYLSAFHSKWQPTDHQLAEFERYVRAAEDPIGTIEDMSRGRVTPEAVEALKKVNPTYFSRLQRGVLDAIMKPEANPSYKQKLLMANLFEIPADPTLSASFINTMQATYAEQAQSGQQPTGSPGGQSPQKSIHIDINPQAIATETSRISNS